MNIVQHYSTFIKDPFAKQVKGRLATLRLNGFERTIYLLNKDEDGSPIKFAREFAERMSKDFGQNVHLVLLDEKNRDGHTWYAIYRKLI